MIALVGMGLGVLAAVAAAGSHRQLIAAAVVAVAAGGHRPGVLQVVPFPVVDLRVPIQDAVAQVADTGIVAVSRGTSGAFAAWQRWLLPRQLQQQPPDMRDGSDGIACPADRRNRTGRDRLVPGQLHPPDTVVPVVQVDLQQPAVAAAVLCQVVVAVAVEVALVVQYPVAAVAAGPVRTVHRHPSVP
uniref:Putative secreted protein n=1 Tax=Anopheles darlingi TaxID=43151 RepID=A0A2M4DI44_ANODA